MAIATRQRRRRISRSKRRLKGQRAGLRNHMAGYAPHGLVRRPDGRGGEGLFAARALPEGFSIECPARFVLSERRAAGTPFGRSLLRRMRAAGRAPPTGRDLLYVTLADARLDARSPFYAYAAALPYPGVDAGSWGRAEADALLGGTPLLAAVRAGDEALARLAARVRPFAPHVTCGDLAWARGMLWSRGFEAGFDGGAATTAYVPFLDFLNHDEAAEVAISRAGRAAPLRFANARPLAEGEEATITYGAGRSNGELLLAYGFAFPGNENDVCNLVGGKAADVADCALKADGVLPPALWRKLGSADPPARGDVERLALALQEGFLALDRHDRSAAAPGNAADYAKIYRDGQRAILRAAMGTCIKMLT